jgi:hypothetical protein
VAVAVTLVDLVLVLDFVLVFVLLVLTLVVVLCLLDEVVDVAVEVVVVMSVRFASAPGKGFAATMVIKRAKKIQIREIIVTSKVRGKKDRIFGIRGVGDGFISIRRSRLFLEP